MADKPKIRIVHVLYSFGTGGLEKGIAMLVRNASPRFDHIVLCLSQAGDSVKLLPSGTRVMTLEKKEGNSPLFLLRLAGTLRSLRPDVVHTRNWSGMDGIIAARLAGISNVVHGEHGWGMEDPDGLNFKRVLVRRFLARCVNRYTCVSQQMVTWLQNDIRVRKPVTQIYNGVDILNYYQGDRRLRMRAELGITTDAFLVGVVGRLDPIKDHATLFKAFEKTIERFPAARLLVVGDGSERSRLEKLAGEGVLFLGHRADVSEILGALDVFVLPSVNEGISNTILEAMATELPVIATEAGGNPELITPGQNGRLVRVGDAAAIAEGLIQYAIQPELAKKHGAAGRQRVKDRFSIPAMVKGYETVYEEVLDQRSIVPSGSVKNYH